MSTNTFESFCDLIENSARHLGGTLRAGMKNLMVAADKNIKKLHCYYQSQGVWSTFGMLSAHFFMLCILGFFYAVLTGLFLAMLTLFFEVSWTTILAANLLTLSLAAALSWERDNQ